MTRSDPLVSLRGVQKRFGSFVAVGPTNIDVNWGDFCAILGPSGCGKSTLLRMIAGFAEPTAGQIVIDGEDATHLPPDRRPTNMVFQGYGLFPHLNVAENVGFGLALRKVPKQERENRVAEALRLVRLDGQGDKRIERLSGGQQQRVALARAIIMRPKVLLLDEPLAALDLKLRHMMQDELRRIHHEVGGTFIFVTHDQSEAFALASRVIVMNEGKIEQVGTPEEVYRSPVSLFVARFVGETNVLRGRRIGGQISLEAGPTFLSPGPDGPVLVMIRPEAVRIGPAPVEVSARLSDRIFLGNLVKLIGHLPSGEEVTVVAPGNAIDAAAGGEVTLGWAPETAAVFSEDA